MPEENLRALDPAAEGRSLLAGRRRLLVGAMLLAVAFGYFGYLGFQGSAVYYLTVAEALEERGNAPGEIVRVNGNLLPESFQREAQGTLASFTLVDPESGQQLQATYEGIFPDLFFNEHSQIVAQGQFEADGHFRSDLIIVKCPSKYASVAESS